MDSHEYMRLRVRLDTLERRQRRFRRMLLASAGAIAALAATAGQSDRGLGGGHVVEAERFVLRDGAGVVRAKLTADPKGRASLTFLDKDEHSRVAIGVAADGAPTMVFGDPDGRTTRMEFRVKSDGTAAVGLADGKGRFRATLEVTPAGASQVALSDGDGRQRTSVSVPADGSPLIALSDSAGKVRARLTSDGREGSPGLFLLDPEGLARVSIGEFPDKSWAVTLADGNRRNRGRLSIGGDGSPGLSLADSDGRVRASINVFSDSSNLLLYDAAGRNRIQVGVWPDGLPAFNLYDPHGETLWSSP
jgi:hypothetical protein